MSVLLVADSGRPTICIPRNNLSSSLAIRNAFSFFSIFISVDACGRGFFFKCHLVPYRLPIISQPVYMVLKIKKFLACLDSYEY